jgi:hypothetical protein
MDLLHLVDRLEELVASAQKMPIGSRAIVDRRRLLDLVDQMRIAIPQEVREAQEMVAARDAHRREAEEEARLIIARAEDRAARMVEQHELTLAARKRAEEVARQAEARLEERIEQANADIDQRIAESRRIASQQMDAADEYARELLSRLDRQLQAFVRSVSLGLEQLQAPDHPHVPGPQRTTTPAATNAFLEPSRGVEAGGAPVIMDDEPRVRRLDTLDDEDEEQDEDDRPSPIPLHREEPEGRAEHADDGDFDLLRRRTPRPPVQPLRDVPGVIDDFSIPPLDDQPDGRK